MSAPVVVLGAGLSGLGAATQLKRRGVDDVVVFEAEATPGGLARTFKIGDFHFDHAIHILYTRDAWAEALIRGALPHLAVQERLCSCFTEGVYTEYPYQLHQFGLPPEVVADNVVGLVEARTAQGPPAHFAEWITQTFGAGIARRFMHPYNEKVWAWKLEEMGFGWIADRVPVPDLRAVLAGALQPPKERFGPNGAFWYPAQGGIGALAEALAAPLADQIRYEQRVVAVDADAHTVRLADGSVVPYRALVTTAPLPRLLQKMSGAPPHIHAAAAGLAQNLVHTVNVGLEGAELGLPAPLHWAYYPDPELSFHRLCFPHRFSPWMAPAGASSVQSETSSSPHRPISPHDLCARVLADLVRVGILAKGEERPVSEGGRVRTVHLATLDPAYVIYTLDHAARRDEVQAWLRTRDIYSCGRFGDWEYLNMDQSLLAGRDAADRLCG